MLHLNPSNIKKSNQQSCRRSIFSAWREEVFLFYFMKSISCKNTKIHCSIEKCSRNTMKSIEVLKRSITLNALNYF